MQDALATLKSASGGKSGYLYDLPWYVIIGPPGAGKTTALVNSGLKFPLAQGGHPAAVAGVGGTRYCDWWFTEEAVLIDTAGRYTTQDSGYQVGQAELVLVSRSAEEKPSASTDQRRDRRYQRRRPTDACRRPRSPRTRLRFARDCLICTSGSRSNFPSMRFSRRPTW